MSGALPVVEPGRWESSVQEPFRRGSSGPAGGGPSLAFLRVSQVPIASGPIRTFGRRAAAVVLSRSRNPYISCLPGSARTGGSSVCGRQSCVFCCTCRIWVCNCHGCQCYTVIPSLVPLVRYRVVATPVELAGRRAVEFTVQPPSIVHR